MDALAINCRLCLRKSITEEEVIHIFDEVGMKLNVPAIVRKHFWFEPKYDDPVSTVICNGCWLKVSDFNNFYLSVEEAHRIFAERFSIKTEDINELQRNSVNGAVAVSTTFFNRISKHEPHEEEAGEVNFEFSIPHIKICETEKKIEEAFDDEIDIADILTYDEEHENGNECEDVLDMVIKEDEAVEKSLTGRLTRKGKNSTRTSKRKLKMHVKESNEEKAPPRKLRGRPLSKSKSENIKTNMKKLKTPRESAFKTKIAKKSLNSIYAAYKTNLDDKISQHTSLVCHICTSELPTFMQLRHHMEESHSLRKGYAMCCNKKFYRRILLVEHIDKHLNPDRFKCDECNKIFANNQCLRNHNLGQHQPDEVKTYECKHCPKKFAKFYLLAHHRLKHKARTHICDECSKGFTTATLLMVHIKQTHENEGIMCDVCARVLRGRDTFKKHMLEHTGTPEPKQQCTECGSWHKNQRSLTRHKRHIHNEEEGLHVCSFCGKVSPNRIALLSHQRYVHRTERKFECNICKKAFKKSITLKEHMAGHTGEVLYKCPHCTTTFNSNANMHSHRKKMHPVEFEEARKQRRGNV